MDQCSRAGTASVVMGLGKLLVFSALRFGGLADDLHRLQHKVRVSIRGSLWRP